MNPAASAGPAGVARRSRAAPRRATAARRRRRARPPPRAAAAACRGGATCDALQEAALDPARERARVRQPEAAGQLGRRQPARQLQQRQRVAARLGDDPVADPLVQPPGRGRGQQRAGVARRRALRRAAPAARRARRRRPARGRANTIATARPAGAGRRTRAPARRPGRATGHRRSGTRSGRDLGRLGQQAQDREGDQEAVRRRRRPAGRTPPAARPAAGAGQRARAGRAAARTGGAARRTRAPSPTARRRPARRGTPSALGDVLSSAVLPIPASPRSTSTALSPGRTRSQQPVQRSHSRRRPCSTGATLPAADRRPLGTPGPRTRAQTRDCALTSAAPAAEGWRHGLQSAPDLRRLDPLRGGRRLRRRAVFYGPPILFLAVPWRRSPSCSARRSYLAVLVVGAALAATTLFARRRDAAAAGRGMTALSEADTSFVHARPRLIGIARRVLGSPADADDMVQEAWMRWQARPTAPGARSHGVPGHDHDTARAQRRPVRPGPARDRVRTAARRARRPGRRPRVHCRAARRARARPVDAARAADPTERAVYVLREAFDYPHRRIAEVVGLSEANARQLVTRARRHVAGEPRWTVDPAEHAALVEAFIAAAPDAATSRGWRQCWRAGVRRNGFPARRPDIFPGFAAPRLRDDARNINALVGGNGPPLLLLHGYPETPLMWHAARRCSPPPHRRRHRPRRLRRRRSARRRRGHDAHSKRALAARPGGGDGRARLRRLRRGRARPRRARGVPDGARSSRDRARGSRCSTSCRPARCGARTTAAVARGYWHWLFLALPAPVPERLIAGDPDAYFDLHVRGHRARASPAATRGRCSTATGAARRPGAVEAMCEDYRAGATVDVELDEADRPPAGDRLPGARAVVRPRRPAALLRRRARGLARRGPPTCAGRRVDAAHFLAEDRRGSHR